MQSIKTVVQRQGQCEILSTLHKSICILDPRGFFLLCLRAEGLHNFEQQIEAKAQKASQGETLFKEACLISKTLEQRHWSDAMPFGFFSHAPAAPVRITHAITAVMQEN